MKPLNIKHRLLEAHRKLFRPLVRILLRNGVSFAEFSDVTRDVFIEECIKDSWRRGDDCSISRLAIVTGLPRRSIEHVVAGWGDGDANSDRNRLARITRLLTVWSTDPQYTGPYGWPADLPVDLDDSITSNERHSFAELTRLHSGGVAPEIMLQDLLAVGAIRKLESGMLRLESRAYIPDALTDASLNRLASVVSNVVETLDYNVRLEQHEEARFERTVTADHGLSAKQIPRLSAFLQERGGQFLEELDAWMSANPTAPQDEPLGVGVGVYLYVENEADRWNPAEFGLKNPLSTELSN